MSWGACQGGERPVDHWKEAWAVAWETGKRQSEGEQPQVEEYPCSVLPSQWHANFINVWILKWVRPSRAHQAAPLPRPCCGTRHGHGPASRTQAAALAQRWSSYPAGVRQGWTAGLQGKFKRCCICSLMQNSSFFQAVFQSRDAFSPAFQLLQVLFLCIIQNSQGSGEEITSTTDNSQVCTHRCVRLEK